MVQTVSKARTKKTKPAPTVAHLKVQIRELWQEYSALLREMKVLESKLSQSADKLSQEQELTRSWERKAKESERALEDVKAKLFEARELANQLFYGLKGVIGKTGRPYS